MKNKSNIALIILAFLLGFFYHYNHLQKQPIKTYYFNAFMQKERLSIVENGDTCAYKLYMDSVVCNKRIPRSNSFFYSFIMDICYGYVPANYDAYRTLMAVYPDANTMDGDTEKLCIFLLRRGADNGDNRCSEALEKMNIGYERPSICYE